jgi:hypothetical protein
MGRPRTVIDWTPAPAATEAERLRERLGALKDEQRRIEDRLWALATEPEPPAIPPPADWLSPREAAARYGWNVQTIRGWARAGRVRTVQAGGYWRVFGPDLEALHEPRRPAIQAGT